MGRVNKYKIKNRTKKDPHWVDFGNWLEYSRGLTQLSQKEMALALEISTRQWIRYTKGAPFPRKRIAKMVKVLGLKPHRAYFRAGYELPHDLGLLADAHLCRIRDAVFADSMANALWHLYSFFYDIYAEKRKTRLPECVTTCQDFVNVAVALDEMPSWLRQEFIEYLLATEKGHLKYEYPLKPALQKKIRLMIKKNLPITMAQNGRIRFDEIK